MGDFSVDVRQFRTYLDVLDANFWKRISGNTATEDRGGPSSTGHGMNLLQNFMGVEKRA